MKRNYVGTYVKMLIVILIIILLMLGVIYFIKRQYVEENFQTAKTNMLLIEAKIKVIAEKVIMKEKDITYVGTKLSEMQEDEQIKQLLDKGIISLDEKAHSYYVLKKEDLAKLDLATIEKKEGYYIVDYKEIDVIDSIRIQDVQGNEFYRLTQML